MKRIRVRCSSLPRYFACASSAGEAEAFINGSSDESDLGDAAHEALGCVVLNVDPDLVDIAKRQGVDHDELERLVAYGRKAWRELAKYFPAPKVEERLESDYAPGTADILHADGVTLVVGDWKSGRIRRNHTEQMAGYASAALEKFGAPESGEVTSCVIWLRDLEAEVVVWTVAELEQWRARYDAQQARIGKEYAPGEHCGFCPLRLECRAHQNYLTTSATALMTAPPATVTPQLLASLYPQSRALKKALDSYEAALKEQLEQHGSLAIGDGTVISLGEGTRSEIDAKAAWPILEDEGLSRDDINGLLSVGKGALEEIIGSRAPKGTKGKRQAAVMDRLRTAGAVLTKSFTKFETKKVGASK